MENAPALSMAFWNIATGTPEDIIKRYENWIFEAWQPMSIKLSGISGIDTYKIVKRNLQYPSDGTIYHFENVMAYDNSLKTPERKAIRQDLDAWINRGVRENVWSVIYELVRGFRDNSSSGKNQRDTTIENSPFVHFEALIMPLEQREKYNKWFDDYAGKVFIPMFMQTRGLKGYDYLKLSSKGLFETGAEYPEYFSALYFENLESFEQFEYSPEQVGFQRALRNAFPNGPMYKWYVQYQLVKSFRK